MKSSNQAYHDQYLSLQQKTHGFPVRKAKIWLNAWKRVTTVYDTADLNYFEVVHDCSTDLVKYTCFNSTLNTVF